MVYGREDVYSLFKGWERGGKGVALGGCLLGLVYIGSAVWIFCLGGGGSSVHCITMALQCFFDWAGLGSGPGGVIIKWRGCGTYKTWTGDTVVATANHDGVFGSGDGEGVMEGILIE